MAAITSNGTGGGFYDATTTWAGGVVPVEGDSVTIASTDTVTLRDTRIAGDDSATAFTINGTLIASRVANCSIQFKGLVTVSSTGNLNFGTIASPITSSTTATCILNYSAAMANYKYGLLVQEAARCSFVGATRTVNSVTTASLAASGTSVTVADITGWAVGDVVCFAPTDGTNNHQERKTLTSVTPGTGTTGTIGFSAVSFAHASGCSVSNMSSNVVVKSFNTTNPAYVCFAHTSSTSNGRRAVAYVSFQYVGSDTSAPSTKCFVGGSANAIVNPFSVLQSCSWYNGNTSAGIFLFSWITDNSVTPNDLALLTDNGATGAWIYYAQGTNINISNVVGHYCSSQFVNSGFSQGGQGAVISNSKFWLTNGTTGLTGLNAGYMTYSSCQFHSASGGAALIYNQVGTQILKNCSLGSSDLPGTPTFAYVLDATASLSQVFTLQLNNCNYGTPATAFFRRPANSSSSSTATLLNMNNDPNQQAIYSTNGNFFSDYTVFNRSTSSVRAETLNGNTAFTYTLGTFLAQSGVTYTIVGYLRKNSTYGGSTLPYVQVTGTGLTTQTFTMSNSVDTWEKFTLTCSQSSGSTQTFTLAFTAQSATSTGKAYCDGLVSPPFVLVARHYGYLFDNNIYRTTNSIIQQTNEATVGAYTGISINHGTQTITLTADHSVRELYDYCYYNLCQSANLGVSEFFTSTDGTNFTCTYNLQINNCALTGSGTIQMPSKTLTISGTGSSSLIITDSAGTLVKITLSNMVVGSRVQLYDVAGATELYNAVPGSSTLSFPYTWTSDKTIRYRVMYMSGTTAKQWVEATGTVTNTGMAVTISQVDDTVYNTYGVDGSTVTECSIVGTTLDINVNAPTHTIAAQRLYAYEVYWLSTSGGIRDQTLYIDALDSTHFVFSSGFKIKNLDTVNPLSITGANITPATGNVTDVFDLSNGASIGLNFNRVEGFQYGQGALSLQQYLALS